VAAAAVSRRDVTRLRSPRVGALVALQRAAAALPRGSRGRRGTDAGGSILPDSSLGAGSDSRPRSTAGDRHGTRQRLLLGAALAATLGIAAPRADAEPTSSTPRAAGLHQHSKTALDTVPRAAS
jgi:hypothetical protein